MVLAKAIKQASSEQVMKRMAQLLPKPAHSGNHILDSDRDARREMLLVVIKACVEDDSHVMELHSNLMKRKRAEKVDTSEDLLPDVGVIGRVPEEDRIAALLKITDLTASDIVAAKKHDLEAPELTLVPVLQGGLRNTCFEGPRRK